MCSSIFTWVKNVNNKRKTIGISSVWVSPSITSSVLCIHQNNGKQVVIRVVEHIFTQVFTTTKLPYSPLLFSSYAYYPHRLLLEPKKNI